MKKVLERSSFNSPAIPGNQSNSALTIVEKAITLLETLPGRAMNKQGRPGGLVRFPPTLRPIIIGDLHANRQNLSLILDHENNRADLESGKAACIFLGDALHDDRTGHMKEMQSSIDILDDVLQLMVRYPGKIYYIRGNHDSFDERLRKSGICQGTELKNALLSAKGADYIAAVERLFQSMPVFIIAKHFIITHAGPPHGGLVEEELININDYPEKLHQLMWSRVNEFHSTPSFKEYGEKDIRLTIELLGMPPETHFIVGHNPIWTDGNKIGIWQNVIGIKNHHILYSGYNSAAPYITFIDGAMLVKTAVTAKPEVYYYG